MNPRLCKVKHNPPESYGDCVAACVATILDRDDVPHVFGGPQIIESWALLRAWLYEQGKTLAIFAMDEHEEFMRENNPGVFYILFCRHGDGDHAVVCQDGSVVHNPAWYRYEITKHSMGFYIIGIIGEVVK